MHKTFMYGVLILGYIYGCIYVFNHLSGWAALAMVFIGIYFGLKSFTKSNSEPKKQENNEDEPDEDTDAATNN